MIGLSIFAVCVGAFDFIFKTGYMYMRAKPNNASLLELLGPRPRYLADTEGVTLCVFLLLYLPLRRFAHTSYQKNTSASSEENL